MSLCTHRCRPVPRALPGIAASAANAAIAFVSAVAVLGWLLPAAARSEEPGGSRSEEGTLLLIWGDAPPPLGLTTPSPGAPLRATLVRADGAEIPVELGRFENLAARYQGRRVVVTGLRSSTDAPLVVNSIASDATTEAAIDGIALTGTRRVVFLLLKFADDLAVPHPPQFYDDLINPDEPPPGALFPTTINAFFRRTSFDRFSWDGDVGGVGGVPATDWLTLPFPKSHYAPCGWGGACARLGQIVEDGMTLGVAAGIDFTQYENVNLVLSNDLDCCAWGGGAVFDGKVYSVTWEPPWGQDTGIYVHEMGHSLGLPHSGWVYEAYDSPWDMMSAAAAASGNVCGSYFSRNSGASSELFCSEPGNGYIAAHRDFLGWIPETHRIVLADPDESTELTLEGAALPLGEEGAAEKMAKICLPELPCSGPSARFLSVEARVRGLGPLSQFDNAIPGDGVVLHDFQADRAPIGAGNSCFFNRTSGWAVPIDATPGDFDGPPACTDRGGLENAQWLPGQTYDDPSGIRVRVLSRTGSRFEVAVLGLRVFAYGFESGDLLAWSSSVGALEP